MPENIGDKMKEWIPAITSLVSLVSIGCAVYLNLTVDKAKSETEGKVELLKRSHEKDMESITDKFTMTYGGVDRRFVVIEKRVDVVESNQKSIIAMINKKFEDASDKAESLKDQLYETQKAVLELRTPIKVIESRLQELSKDD